MTARNENQGDEKYDATVMAASVESLSERRRCLVPPFATAATGPRGGRDEPSSSFDIGQFLRTPEGSELCAVSTNSSARSSSSGGATSRIGTANGADPDQANSASAVGARSCGSSNGRQQQALHAALLPTPGPVGVFTRDVSALLANSCSSDNSADDPRGGGSGGASMSMMNMGMDMDMDIEMDIRMLVDIAMGTDTGGGDVGSMHAFDMGNMSGLPMDAMGMPLGVGIDIGTSTGLGMGMGMRMDIEMNRNPSQTDSTFSTGGGTSSSSSSLGPTRAAFGTFSPFVDDFSIQAHAQGASAGSGGGGTGNGSGNGSGRGIGPPASDAAMAPTSSATSPSPSGSMTSTSANVDAEQFAPPAAAETGSGSVHDAMAAVARANKQGAHQQQPHKAPYQQQLEREQQRLFEPDDGQQQRRQQRMYNSDESYRRAALQRHQHLLSNLVGATAQQAGTMSLSMLTPMQLHMPVPVQMEMPIPRQIQLHPLSTADGQQQQTQAHEQCNVLRTRKRVTSSSGSSMRNRGSADVASSTSGHASSSAAGAASSAGTGASGSTNAGGGGFGAARMSLQQRRRRTKAQQQAQRKQQERDREEAEAAAAAAAVQAQARAQAQAHAQTHAAGLPSPPTPKLPIPSAEPPLHAPPLPDRSQVNWKLALLKVMFRPDAQLHLGPVDHTCSFTISDCAQRDDPIVYCSESFLELTGYSSAEILQRNCRFLQSPDGKVDKGAPRMFTDQGAVAHLKRHIERRKESQASFLNYRKGGNAFINLVTIVPIDLYDCGSITHLVGFQVDLAKQPGAVMRHMENSSYVVDYTKVIDHEAHRTVEGASISPEERRRKVTDAKVIAAILKEDVGVEAMDVTDGGDTDAPEMKKKAADSAADDDKWPEIILNNSSDLIWALSTSLDIAYVSPSITAFLGYKAHDLVGKSLSHLLHPADTVQVFRDLKDVFRAQKGGPADKDKDKDKRGAKWNSDANTRALGASTDTSAVGAGASTIATEDTAAPLEVGPPKSLMESSNVSRFPLRMITSSGAYRWIDNVGHIQRDTRRSRRYLVLAGRARSIYHVSSGFLNTDNDAAQSGRWSRISRDGIILHNVPTRVGHTDEFAGMIGHSAQAYVAPESWRSYLEALQSPNPVVLRYFTRPGVLAEGQDVISKFYSPSGDGMPQDSSQQELMRKDDDSRTRWVHTIPTPADTIMQPNTVYRCPDGETDPHGAFHSSIFSEFLSNQQNSWMVELRQMQMLNKRLKDEIQRVRESSQAKQQQQQHHHQQQQQ
ncbi:hypothetical protein K437DRAFT_137654 [Tilletiaria anomala UBC 951]|uniref:PAS domain-containing protein n=1 Tax=Tilletiaria anomala (strain ATCC 24038 / CBS 436.72 / UBC 951) TaxID=1037660 RepID=A0A066VW47_TILAU|nr:uncharacterized protein K437DRAFT_137654 [Tilletiaria anomala UBC 951]KDN44508.1 hypothetical protein K437DRAFT_137654 [Tilletiaria anomala UBC 951]